MRSLFLASGRDSESYELVITGRVLRHDKSPVVGALVLLVELSAAEADKVRAGLLDSVPYALEVVGSLVIVVPGSQIVNRTLISTTDGKFSVVAYSSSWIGNYVLLVDERVLVTADGVPFILRGAEGIKHFDVGDLFVTRPAKQ
jgi:hypothetical protein